MIPARVPEKNARWALISEEYPALAQGLQRHGVEALCTVKDSRLPAPVQDHPDIQACFFSDRVIILKGHPIKDTLARCGVWVEETNAAPGNTYPKDVLCNALAWDKFLLCNPKTVDRRILQAAEAQGLTLIAVKQGYAACSTALVDKRSAITADYGVASALERAGLEILQVRPGYIQLPGYDTGFWGGCCGLLGPRLMGFAGDLYSHPDGERVAAFLQAHGVAAVSLMDGALTDVGGIVSLC